MNKWNELSRYVWGSTADEKDFYDNSKGYCHGPKTWNWLENHCFIGILKTFEKTKNWPLLNSTNNEPAYSKGAIWKKTNIIKLKAKD